MRDFINEFKEVILDLKAKKPVTQMSAYSAEFLHAEIKPAILRIEQAPPEAQKHLIQALIKEVLIHDDTKQVELKMFLDNAINKKLLTATDEELTAKPSGLTERPFWLLELDSNQQPSD